MEPSAGRGRPLLAASRRAAFSLLERLSGRAVQGSLAASHSRRLGVSGRHLSPVAAPGSRFCKSGSRALRSPIKLSVRGALRPCASACLSAGISPSSQGALLSSAGCYWPLRWAPPPGAWALPALHCPAPGLGLRCQGSGAGSGAADLPGYRLGRVGFVTHGGDAPKLPRAWRLPRGLGSNGRVPWLHGEGHHAPAALSTPGEGGGKGFVGSFRLTPVKGRFISRGTQGVQQQPERALPTSGGRAEG